jgi:hypothetical protein
MLSQFSINSARIVSLFLAQKQIKKGLHILILIYISSNLLSDVVYEYHRVSERSEGYVVFCMYFSFQGLQVYIETLLDCDAYSVQCTPSVTHQQIHYNPE